MSGDARRIHGRAPLDAAGLRRRALRLLALRDYSEHELRTRLVRAGAPLEQVLPLIASLRAAGYLSDQRTAEAAVRSQRGRFSRRRIAAALRAKGIDEVCAQQALSGLEQDDFDTALALLKQRFGSPAVDDRDRARRLRFLQSRGFAAGVALRVLRATGSETMPTDE